MKKKQKSNNNKNIFCKASKNVIIKKKLSILLLK